MYVIKYLRIEPIRWQQWALCFSWNCSVDFLLRKVTVHSSVAYWQGVQSSIKPYCQKPTFMQTAHILTL
jgi:hypothetical protein